MTAEQIVAPTWGERHESQIATSKLMPRGTNSPLTPFLIGRREPTPDDIQIDILFCGVCRSDLHALRDKWGGTTGLGSDVEWHVICGDLLCVDF